MRLRKNIDLLAVALLLAGAGVMYQAGHSPTMQYGSARVVEFTSQRVQPLLSNYHFPKLCLMRD